MHPLFQFPEVTVFMLDSSVPTYRIIAEVGPVVVVLGSVYYIYRRRRQRRLENATPFEAEKADGVRPWSRRCLINRNSLESASGLGAEGEEGRHSFDFGSPIALTDGSLPAFPPLAFIDARLVRQPEASLALPPPELGPADLAAQPSAAFLPSYHVRRGSDVAAAPHAVAHRHDSVGFYSVRSSLTSSSLPPSYHSRYPDPEDSHSLVAPSNQRPAYMEGGEDLKGVVTRCPTRAFDGGVRLAGGRPDEGGSGDSGSNHGEGSVTPPTYHDW